MEYDLPTILRSFGLPTREQGRRLGMAFGMKLNRTLMMGIKGMGEGSWVGESRQGPLREFTLAWDY